MKFLTLPKPRVLNILCALVLCFCALITVTACTEINNNPSLATRHYSDSAAFSGNLWDRLPGLFQMETDNERPEVQQQLHWFINHNTYLNIIARRSTPYLYYVMEQVQQRQLPGELALIPIVESAYNPFLYSSMGAAGLWQLMPGTASMYHIQQDWWYDGRRDLMASTNAALNYLSYLHRLFGDNWQLILAAYNSGEGTVQNAIKRNRRAHKSTDFWSLRLPQQAINYVAKVHALAILFEDPKSFNIEIPGIPDTPYLTKVKVGHQIDMARAAKLAGISLDEMYELNPGYQRWATSPEGPHHLLVPIEKAAAFRQRLVDIPLSEFVTWQRHKIKAGDSLSVIAQQHGTSIELLQKVNKLKSHNITVGHMLLIPEASRSLNNYALTSLERFHTTARPSAAPRKIEYHIKAGDSLWKIAKQFKVRQNAILAWNHISAKQPLKLGQKLIIWKSRYRAPVAKPRVPRHQVHQAAKHVVKHAVHVAKEQEGGSGSGKEHVTYVVLPGDKLRLIASWFNTSVDLIKQSNNLHNNMIKIGQELIIPESPDKSLAQRITYKIRRGDNLSRIGHHFKVSVNNIQRWNHLEKDSLLRPGDTLVLYTR